jgi:hypothetical protein
MIHTCPRCELRFSSETELTDHLKVDHQANPEEFERLHYKPKPVKGVGKRYLLLANRTLEEPWLLPRLLDLAEGGHFHIVVAPTAVDRFDRADDKELALASYRLRHMVDKLHEADIEAEGEVGHTDPLRAVTRALEHQKADEILIATLPLGASKWLDVDLPAALHRRFGLPVTTLTEK